MKLGYIVSNATNRFDQFRVGLGHPGARILRVMPNLPIRVGAGVAGLFAGRHADPDDLAPGRAYGDQANRYLGHRLDASQVVTRGFREFGHSGGFDQDVVAFHLDVELL